MKEYAEICKDFKHCACVPIDRGKCCLACWHYWQTNEKIWDSWRCDIPMQRIRRTAYFEAQANGQIILSINSCGKGDVEKWDSLCKEVNAEVKEMAKK